VQDKVGLTLRHGRLYVRDVCPIAFATIAQRDESDRIEREQMKKQTSLDGVEARGSKIALNRAHSIEHLPTAVGPKRNNNKNTKNMRRRMLRANTHIRIDLRLTEEEVMADENARWWRGSRRGEVLAWSRIHYNCEVLVVLNTNPTEERRALVTIDRRLQERKHASRVKRHEDATHPTMSILYHSQWSDATLEAVLASPSSSLYSSLHDTPIATAATAEEQEDKQRVIKQLNRTVPVQQQKDGRFFVSIHLPAAAMVILH
jgi:hypothetical protein